MFGGCVRSPLRGIFVHLGVNVHPFAFFVVHPFSLFRGVFVNAR